LVTLANLATSSIIGVKEDLFHGEFLVRFVCKLVRRHTKRQRQTQNNLTN
jgi:hypothetical protein